MILYYIENELKQAFYVVASNFENAIKTYKEKNKEEILLMKSVTTNIIIGD